MKVVHGHRHEYYNVAPLTTQVSNHNYSQVINAAVAPVQVQSEVSEMWSVMESAANARAGRLVDSLNAAIQGLGARLEGVVEEGLQVNK